MRAGDRVIEAGDAVVLDFEVCGTATGRTPPGPSAWGTELGDSRGARGGASGAAGGCRCGTSRCELSGDRPSGPEVITEAGYGEAFIHRTGHGIGVTTHEPPYMVEGEEQAAGAGHVLLGRAGIYLAGRFGVRIEDIVTVTADGGRRLNNTDHGLRVVE